MPERIRLHISPLNPELLAALVPPSVLPTASGISYHTLQTFPDRNYGYIELPAMEAEKIRKKLNGSVLKGHKVRVEEARPEKKVKRAREYDAVNDIVEEHAAKKARKTKTKQKSGDGVLSGYELPGSRKVKRGWTDSKGDRTIKPKKDKKEKKSKAKASSLTGKPECLFRTNMPPNATKTLEMTSKSSSTAKLTKKGKSSRKVVVHEFTNTTKHANFLRESQVIRGEKVVTEYVDGTGWVDKNGNIVEAEPLTHRPRSKPKEEAAPIDKDETGSSDSGADKSQGGIPEDQSLKLTLSSLHHEADGEMSSSGTPSISESESEDGEEVPKASGEAIASAEASDESSINSSNSDNATKERFENPITETRLTSRSTSSMSMDIEGDATPKPDDATTEPERETKEVHPLEALFKRPKSTASSTPRKPTLEVQTSFSFFDPDAADESSSRITTIPQTPFTQRDIQERRLRSAAPTPDTAAPGKTFANVWAGDPDIEEIDEDENEGEEATTESEANSTPLAGKGNPPEEDGKGKSHESDFAKWFWENRGETNRAWKKRRREAAKEKRQREIGKHGRSAV